MKGFFFLGNSAVLMASICAVGNPLLSPQDASSFSSSTVCSLHGPIYHFFPPFVPPLFLLLCLGFLYHHRKQE